jgi:hypothetical protein
MSSFALSIDARILWMLCYLEVTQHIASLPEFAQFSGQSAFRAVTANLTANTHAHARAIRAALSPDILRRQAPWV